MIIKRKFIILSLCILVCIVLLLYWILSHYNRVHYIQNLMMSNATLHYSDYNKNVFFTKELSREKLEQFILFISPIKEVNCLHKWQVFIAINATDNIGNKVHISIYDTETKGLSSSQGLLKIKGKYFATTKSVQEIKTFFNREN
jgi:hypothetical protein